MPMIDFVAVKRAVSLSAVLELLGRLPRVHHKTQHQSWCPLGCPGSRACGFNFAKNIWHCFKCHRCGNQLDLYRIVRRMTIHQAALDLCNRLGINPPLLPYQPTAALREPKESETDYEERPRDSSGAATEEGRADQ